MLSAFLLIAVNPGTERSVYDKLKELKEVKSINEIYGEWDIITLVETEDTTELDTLLSEKIRKISDVKLTSTMIVAR